MGAWIEIRTIYDTVRKAFVAPHDGCVDWNLSTERKE